MQASAWRAPLWLAGALMLAVPAAQAATAPEIAPLSTADHSKFKELQGPFTSGPEVTKACLECHTVPTTKGLGAVIRYYTVGIFDPSVKHPHKKTRAAKHNPLQRLAYLGFKLLISPALWVSGLLYMYYNDIEGLPLGVVAGVHTAAAFAMLVFFIGHVYMATTAKPWNAYIRSMITGYEEVEG